MRRRLAAWLLTGAMLFTTFGALAFPVCAEDAGPAETASAENAESGQADSPEAAEPLQDQPEISGAPEQDSAEPSGADEGLNHTNSVEPEAEPDAAKSADAAQAENKELFAEEQTAPAEESPGPAKAPSLFVSAAPAAQARSAVSQKDSWPAATQHEPWIFDPDTNIGFMLHWGISSSSDWHTSEQRYNEFPEWARTVTEWVDEYGYTHTRVPGWDAEIANIDLDSWVDEAEKLQADYISFAGFHSCLGYIRPWHSDVPGFPETERDLLGELIEKAHARGIKVVVYMTTSVNHMREDEFGYFRPDEYVRWAQNNDTADIDAIYGEGTAASLTEEQWQISFNPVDNSYGFGAWSFDEIEYLMTHYDIDGVWFDALNNPTWLTKDNYSFSGGFDYDGCTGYGGINGYIDRDGNAQPCSDPEAHARYQYGPEDFEKYYFYKRDIQEFIKSLDAGCATLVNNFPPLLNADVIGQETITYGDSFEIIHPTSNIREGLFCTGSIDGSGGFMVTADENLPVQNQKELRRIVHAVAAGGIATIAQGPARNTSKWPNYEAQFNEFMAQFNAFAGKSYAADGLTRGYDQAGNYTTGAKANGAYVAALQDEQAHLRYLHVLQKPTGNELKLENAVAMIRSVRALTPDGDVELPYTQTQSSLTITIDDWSLFDTWGDYVICVEENTDPTAAEIAEYLNLNFNPQLDGGRLVLPEIYGTQLTVDSAIPSGVLGADGSCAEHTGVKVVTFRLLVEKDGDTARTDEFRVVSSADGRSLALAGATASSEQPGEGPASYAIDGSETTIWHSNYTSGLTLPQSLTVELSGEVTVGAIEYLPRQDGDNGVITRYEIQTSTDGVGFTTVCTGTWESNTQLKTASFEPVRARYVRLVALENMHGFNFVSCAEFRVLGAGSYETAQPILLKPGTSAKLPELADGVFAVMDESVASIQEGRVQALKTGETFVVWDGAQKSLVIPVKVKEYFPELSLTFTPSEDDETAGVLKTVLKGADEIGGKSITLSVNGDTYIRTTDAEGVAALEVRGLSREAETAFGAAYAGDARNASAEAQPLTYKLESVFYLGTNFETAENQDYFVNSDLWSGCPSGELEITEGEDSISGEHSLRIYNAAGTTWLNDAMTKDMIATDGITGFAFRLKASAGMTVKPWLSQKDMQSGFRLFDTDGNAVTTGYNYDGTWCHITFTEDFDGYCFIPFSDEGFKEASSLGSYVRFSFHFANEPAYNPEYVIDDFGTYVGTDYAQLIQQMKASADAAETAPAGETLDALEKQIRESVVYLDAVSVSHLPEMPQGYSLDIVSSTGEAVIALDGTVTPPASAQDVTVVYELSCTLEGEETSRQILMLMTYSVKAGTSPADTAHFLDKKYGMFVHYVWTGTRDGVSAMYPDGTYAQTIDEMIENFDAQQFAQDCADAGMQYVIFTAWHYRMNPVYHSDVYEAWRDHTAADVPSDDAEHDLIEKVWQALDAKGIDLYLYTHPYDLHDFTDADKEQFDYKYNGDLTFDYDKWNDYINEQYAELCERYAGKIKGLFIDEGLADPANDLAVDYPRLRDTIKSVDPGIVMIANEYHGKYSCDTSMLELPTAWHGGEFDRLDTWQVNSIPVATTVGSFTQGYSWTASKPRGAGADGLESAENLFRYTVLQAAANTQGGGIVLAAGPFCGGDEQGIWEDGVRETLMQLRQYLDPVRAAVTGTRPSAAYPLAAGSTFADVEWGAATQSADGTQTYLHILKPGSGRSVTIGAPADGWTFQSAHLLNGADVAMSAGADGSLTLTLPDGVAWDALDTVIVLTSEAPSSGPDDKPGPGRNPGADSGGLLPDGTGSAATQAPQTGDGTPLAKIALTCAISFTTLAALHRKRKN